MPASRDFADHIADLLAPLGPLRVKSMFGGFGLYMEETMFGLIAADQLYFRIDDETRDRFAEAGGAPFVSSARGKGKSITMPYITPPDSALDDADDLLVWAQLAVDASLRVRAAKNKTKKRPTPRSRTGT